MKECEVRGRVGRELAVCQEYTLELCTVQSWRTTAQREGGREREWGRGDRETDSSGQMEPCLFWSSWLLLRAGLVCMCVCVCIRGRKHITSRTANHCFLLMWTDILLLLSVEALYAAQGQEDPAAAAAASGNCPIWILGPAEAGGHEFPPAAAPSLSIGTLCRAIGLWGGCEAWTAVSTSHSTVGPASLSLCRRRRGGEWARPHCRTTQSRRRKSPRRRWRVTATFCRPAPSWRALCSVSTHDAADSPHLTSGNIILHLLSNCFTLVVLLGTVQPTETEMHQSKSLFVCNFWDAAEELYPG